VGVTVIPFISRDDLGDYLRRDLLADDQALIAVDAACQICRDIAEQTFDLVSDETIKLSGSGTYAMLLPQLPVVSVDNVILDDETLEADQYFWDEEGFLFRASHLDLWSVGVHNLEVTYTHGYEEVPTSVRLVALALAARIYDQGIVQQETIGGYVILYGESEGGLTKLEKRILERHRPGR
jgi:hypothetical protein